MIKFHFRELLIEKENQLGQRIPLREVSEATGISVQVLSSLASPSRQIVTNTAFVESICRYFACALSDLMEFDPGIDTEDSCHVDELYPERKR